MKKKTSKGCKKESFPNYARELGQSENNINPYYYHSHIMGSCPVSNAPKKVTNKALGPTNRVFWIS